MSPPHRSVSLNNAKLQYGFSIAMHTSNRKVNGVSGRFCTVFGRKKSPQCFMKMARVLLSLQRKQNVLFWPQSSVCLYRKCVLWIWRPPRVQDYAPIINDAIQNFIISSWRKKFHLHTKITEVLTSCSNLRVMKCTAWRYLTDEILTLSSETYRSRCHYTGFQVYQSHKEDQPSPQLFGIWRGTVRMNFQTVTTINFRKIRELFSANVEWA